MRVLYVVTGSEYGGPSRHVLALVEHFIKQGQSAGIVCAPERRLLDAAKRCGAEIFPNAHFIRPVRLVSDMRAVGPVLRAVREFKPDLVSAHSTKAGFAARLACALLGQKRVIFTAHGWAFTEGRAGRNRWLLAKAERIAAKVTERIICVSQYDYDLALRFRVAPRERLMVIRNGIDVRPFAEAGGRRRTGASGRMAEPPVITMVGRLVPQKDPLNLLAACRRLREDFRLILIGEGELREELERLISKNGLKEKVTLLGERVDIPGILVSSDVFVLPSRWEGLPRAIIEAMMVGLPVVATRVGGVPELVEDGVNGLLVPPGDPERMALALETLLRGKEQRQRMGQAGRDRALREFTLERMLRETEVAYEEILSSQ